MRSVAQRGFLLLIFWTSLGGCRFGQNNSGPTIEFTRVPPAASNSSDTLDIIEGRVSGVRAGEQIVLYAKNGMWWLQPTINEEFTKIGPDSTWTNTVHMGADYAVLVVEAGYQPSAKLNELPTPGGGVAAVAVANRGDAGLSPPKRLSFSGYEWRVRDVPSSRGGNNIYDPRNAWTDSDGALHLKIAMVAGEWTCTEVTLMRNFGYGTYSFVVRDTSKMEPAAVLGMFTWDQSGSDPNNREMDVDVSRWGDPESKNAQFVVQPYYVPANAVRFSVPSGVMTYSIRWEPGRATFRAVAGSGGDSKARRIIEHVFMSGVPTPGIESARVNLFVLKGAKVPLRNGAEVVIERFEYLP
jgi:hypothetical protein